MERILIADEDKATRDILAFALRREGYSTSYTQSGAEAIRLCTGDCPPDLMILDVVFFDKNGLDVCREVRKFSDLPIIFLSAKSDTVDKILGLELGADDYITKPFDAKEVAARVRAVLRRIKNLNKSEIHDKKVVKYEDLEINMNRYEMRVGGKVQETPPKELELLFRLASNPNKVFTRDQLLDDVWGFEYYGDSRTIDVHIKRLRARLAGVSRKWFLKTVWGVGYKFELVE
ncbi:MAG: response regulator transcription factor [Oscillospiraceae bacterium]|jgi:DNA-binding response OmpR family regulator|nr:response regulator transcription factor [Oscillospiraceae bacterium]